MWFTVPTGRLLADLGYDLHPEAVRFLSGDLHLLEYFLRLCVHDHSLGPEAAKWLMGTLSEAMPGSAKDWRKDPVKAMHMREFLEMARAREFTPTDGKAVLREMHATGRPARETAAFAACRYADGDELAALVAAVAAEHPDKAALARSGDARVAGWLVGRVMRAAGGRADASAARALLVA